MKYLVLDGPQFSRPYPFAYRGIHRKQPPYCYSQPKDHRINLLWAWYAEETYEFDGARNRDVSLHYADLCNENFPDMHFEVIGTCEESHHPQNDDLFLGFDITWPTSVTLPEVLELKPDRSSEPLDVLNGLIKCYFAPKLNESGLFRTMDDASHCCRNIMAVQHFEPFYYDCGSGREQSTAIGVYLISNSR